METIGNLRYIIGNMMGTQEKIHIYIYIYIYAPKYSDEESSCYSRAHSSITSHGFVQTYLKHRFKTPNIYICGEDHSGTRRVSQYKVFKKINMSISKTKCPPPKQKLPTTLSRGVITCGIVHSQYVTGKFLPGFYGEKGHKGTIF